MDWDSLGYRLMTISVGILVAIIIIGFGVNLTMSFVKENYKCDTEKQTEFILKCITINPNNKNQPEIIEKCNESAKIFCTPEIITKQ